MGNLANCPPSPFGEGRGEAISLTLSYPMNSFPTSQTQRGISLFTPLSLRRGVGGEAASGVFQAAFLCTIREGSVHIAPRSPPINEKRGRASLRDLHRNLVSNYYKIVISKVGFLSIQATSLSRQSLCLQQRERCCASAESLNSLGIVHHIIDT